MIIKINSGGRKKLKKAVVYSKNFNNLEEKKKKTPLRYSLI
jgi:predicted nucleotidyltransferase